MKMSDFVIGDEGHGIFPKDNEIKESSCRAKRTKGMIMSFVAIILMVVDLSSSLKIEDIKPPQPIFFQIAPNLPQSSSTPTLVSFFELEDRLKKYPIFSIEDKPDASSPIKFFNKEATLLGTLPNETLKSKFKLPIPKLRLFLGAPIESRYQIKEFQIIDDQFVQKTAFIRGQNMTGSVGISKPFDSRILVFSIQNYVFIDTSTPDYQETAPPILQLSGKRPCSVFENELRFECYYLI